MYGSYLGLNYNNFKFSLKWNEQQKDTIDGEVEMFDLNNQLLIKKDALLEQLQGIYKEKDELMKQYYDHATSLNEKLLLSNQNIEAITVKNEAAFK